MAKVVDSMQEVRDVVFMSNPQPQFVSLVKRGANQQPFAVVKTQKGEEMTRKVLQAVIAPVGTGEDVLKAAIGEDVKFDSKKTVGGFDIYEQLPRGACKSDTFEMFELDKEVKIRGLGAELQEDKDTNFVMKMLKPKKKVEAIEIAESVEKVDASEVQKGLTDSIWDEMYNMSNAVGGILSQREGEPSGKLGAVKMVLDNFYSFLESAFSVNKFDVTDLGEDPNLPVQLIAEAVKTGKKLSQARIARLQEIKDQIEELLRDVSGEEATKTDKSTEEEDMTKEETQQLIDGALAPMREQSDAIKASVEEMLKTLEALKGLSETVEKIQNAIPAPVESKETDDAGEVKPVEKKDKDPYEGALFRRA